VFLLWRRGCLQWTAFAKAAVGLGVEKVVVVAGSCCCAIQITTESVCIPRVPIVTLILRSSGIRRVRNTGIGLVTPGPTVVGTLLSGRGSRNIVWARFGQAAALL